MGSPDYNPDKESHAKHWFYVRNATRRKFDTLTVNGKDMKFNAQGRMRINDEGLAREIQKEYPDELAVTRFRENSGGHTYFFGSMPEMPWKRKERLEKENSTNVETKDSTDNVNSDVAGDNSGSETV